MDGLINSIVSTALKAVDENTISKFLFAVEKKSFITAEAFWPLSANILSWSDSRGEAQSDLACLIKDSFFNVVTSFFDLKTINIFYTLQM